MKAQLLVHPLQNEPMYHDTHTCNGHTHSPNTSRKPQQQKQGSNNNNSQELTCKLTRENELENNRVENNNNNYQG